MDGGVQRRQAPGLTDLAFGRAVLHLLGHRLHLGLELIEPLDLHLRLFAVGIFVRMFGDIRHIEAFHFQPERLQVLHLHGCLLHRQRDQRLALELHLPLLKGRPRMGLAECFERPVLHEILDIRRRVGGFEGEIPDEVPQFVRFALVELFDEIGRRDRLDFRQLRELGFHVRFAVGLRDRRRGLFIRLVGGLCHLADGGRPAFALFQFLLRQISSSDGEVVGRHGLMRRPRVRLDLQGLLELAARVFGDTGVEIEIAQVDEEGHGPSPQNRPRGATQ